MEGSSAEGGQGDSVLGNPKTAKRKTWGLVRTHGGGDDGESLCLGYGSGPFGILLMVSGVSEGIEEYEKWRR